MPKTEPLTPYCLSCGDERIGILRSTETVPQLIDRPLETLAERDAEITRWQNLHQEEAIAAQRIVETANNERIAELERRLRIPFGKLPCAQCGGPHDFDMSVPSAVWNRVIRSKGLPEYLCTTCIVREFVRAGQSFTAELWNEEFNGSTVELRVNGQVANDAALISDENTSLRAELQQANERVVELERILKLWEDPSEDPALSFVEAEEQP